MTRKEGIRPTPGSDPDFHYRWQMCFRKIHYASEVEATKASKRFKYPMSIYVCPVHGPKHWHVTKRPRNGNAAVNMSAAPTLATTSNPTPASGATKDTGTNRIEAILP